MPSRNWGRFTALSALSDEELLDGLPDVLGRLVERVQEKLKELPE
jgi:hypothetical protein